MSLPMYVMCVSCTCLRVFVYVHVRLICMQALVRVCTCVGRTQTHMCQTRARTHAQTHQRTDAPCRHSHTQTDRHTPQRDPLFTPSPPTHRRPSTRAHNLARVLPRPITDTDAATGADSADKRRRHVCSGPQTAAHCTTSCLTHLQAHVSVGAWPDVAHMLV